ncbi:protein ovarian tumor locus-like isoform X2 [Phlebotomus papatasi]|uniref:protein ovarian tumor locus-like isoform X2 n=1 Tax=Phlebotomus papatasi TaxID=29031 RepID=UPI002483980A|nr:protein ovarian tumor locus-like isoform X2 [Phlebotomus papatasi]
MAQRTVAPGSREAPDPHDQLLATLGYYRKHTGRDSSSLFRVISEQLFDTQKHHWHVREECVAFMRRHRDFYSQFVEGDFDNHLMDLSKARTFGGILELQALAARYKRNVYLFEPCEDNTHVKEEYLDYNPEFKKDFKIFFIADNHFDTVYHTDYMENLAFCQALAYEVLYRGVFKLPDVNYAVEIMLHDPQGLTTKITEDPLGKMCGECSEMGDFRQFYCDKSDNTKCVLNNRNLCNFHNPDFDDFVARVKKEEKTQETSKSRTLASTLPMKDLSCVLQLLNAQITPFPYKVAKSLDPYIYRNVDFDVWADMRKEQRLRRSERILRVGMRCSVRLRKSQDQLYNCCIRDIMDNGLCEVLVDELGEYHRVPICQLQPHNVAQFKPCMMPLKYPRPQNDKRNGNDDAMNRATVNNLVKYTKMGEMKPYPIEMVAMPSLIGGHSGGKDNDDQKNFEQNKKNDEKFPNVDYDEMTKHNTLEDEYLYCQEVPPPCPINPPIFYNYDPMSGMYMMPSQYGVQMQPYGNFQMVPPMVPMQPCAVPIYQATSSASTFSVSPPNLPPVSPSSMSQGSMVGNTAIRHDGSVYFSQVNYDAAYSIVPNGSDLPLFDLPTVQFFYNLGVEYFSWLRGHYGLSGAISGIRESQNLPLLNFVTDFEEDRESGRQVVPNIKVEDESQESPEIQHNSAGLCHVNPSPQQRVQQQQQQQQQQQHQDPYQPNTPQSHHSAGKQNHNNGNHSGQSSGGGRNNQQRGNRKDHTSKNSLKKHNQYHGKHQSDAHGKNGGQIRDSSDAGHKAEMVSPSANTYFDLSPGIGTRFDGDFCETMYAVPPPYYGPLDGEPSSSNVNHYAVHQPYYNSSQGLAMPMYSFMPATTYQQPPTPTTTMAAPPMPIAAPCLGPDLTTMPPPMFNQAPPRGVNNGNGMEMGNFLNHNGSTAVGGGGSAAGGAAAGGGNGVGGGIGGSGGQRGNENTSSVPYYFIPHPNSYQLQPAPPIINATTPNRTPANWCQYSSRPPPPMPPSTTVVSHNGNITSGMYSPNTDIPH